MRKGLLGGFSTAILVLAIAIIIINGSDADRLEQIAGFIIIAAFAWFVYYTFNSSGLRDSIYGHDYWQDFPALEGDRFCVYSGSDLIAVELARQLLAGHDIPSFTCGTDVDFLHPFAHGQTDYIRLYVQPKDAEKAGRLLYHGELAAKNKTGRILYNLIPERTCEECSSSLVVNDFQLIHDNAGDGPRFILGVFMAVVFGDAARLAVQLACRRATRCLDCGTRTPLKRP